MVLEVVAFDIPEEVMRRLVVEVEATKFLSKKITLLKGAGDKCSGRIWPQCLTVPGSSLNQHQFLANVLGNDVYSDCPDLSSYSQ